MFSVAINFGSNDSEFIDKEIDECRKFSDDIHVTYCEKFFNGEPENLTLIDEHVKRNLGKASFHKLPWREDIKQQCSHDFYFYKYCHNVTRLNNIQNTKYNYIFFMDSDVIPEGEQVAQWLKTADFNEYSSFFFLIYSYYRTKLVPGRIDEAVVLLSDKRYLTEERVMSLHEIQALLTPPCQRRVTNSDGKPMFHHYGWARGNNDEECKQHLLRKVKSWGHTFDKDWNKIIEDEFSHPFTGSWIP